MKANRNSIFQFSQPSLEENTSVTNLLKKGNKINIKKKNRGKFTEYCGGNITSECIQKGKHSSDSKIRKRATFASNARSWKHYNGGIILPPNYRYTDYNKDIK